MDSLLIKILLLFAILIIYKLFFYRTIDYESTRGNHPSFIALNEHADKGDAQAQYVLGFIYDRGQGVIEDDQHAMYWYSKSAEQDYAQAQYMLADKYEAGQGIKVNYKLAVYWFRKSAENGLARAQNELAVRYYIGRGVATDYVEAYKWFNIASIGGHTVDEKYIISLEKNMSPSQIELAKDLAKKWIRRYD